MRSAPLILIVDDEKDFLEIFSAKLKASGFEIATARTGKQAIAEAEKLVPDLVLMDIHMPNETGTDVALAMKQNPKLQELKIAFLTNLKDPWPAMSGDREKIAQELGMEDFIEKGEDLNVIVQKVQEILTRAAQPPLPPTPPQPVVPPPVPEVQQPAPVVEVQQELPQNIQQEPVPAQPEQPVIIEVAQDAAPPEIQQAQDTQ